MVPAHESAPGTAEGECQTCSVLEQSFPLQKLRLPGQPALSSRLRTARVPKAALLDSVNSRAELIRYGSNGANTGRSIHSMTNTQDHEYTYAEVSQGSVLTTLSVLGIESGNPNSSTYVLTCADSLHPADANWTVPTGYVIIALKSMMTATPVGVLTQQ
jgi:hypothetical protein